MLNLINKDLKSTVRNVFQELTEIMGGGGGSGFAALCAAGPLMPVKTLGIIWEL